LPLLWPFLFEYRGFTAGQIGNIYAVSAVGAFLGPFIAGQIADRYFATEHFLAISHVLAGLVAWSMATVDSYLGFLSCSLAYSLLYLPTVSLTNSLSFHHLPDRYRDFGKIRVWGTVGWIVVGIVVGQWLWHVHTPAGATPEQIRAAQVAGMADAFRLSGVLGVSMGLFCLLLPHTPPCPGLQKYAAWEALTEIRKQPLVTLFLIAVPISCVNQLYMIHAAGFLGRYQLRLSEWINAIFGVGGGGLMTIGQISEVGVLALMPWLVRRFSHRALLAAGLFASAVRLFLFAYVDALPVPPLLSLVVAIAMNGISFGCFVFVGYMIVDEKTTEDVRASAQSLFNLTTFGMGLFAGSYFAAGVASWASTAGRLDYTRLFGLPMWASLACWLALLVFYPRERNAGRK